MSLQGPDSARVYLGLYEIEVNRWIRRLAQRGVRTFDLGAQYGVDALIFARLTGARVLTVEADAGLEPIIRHNVDANKMSRLIEARFDFVGDGTDATATIDELASAHFVPGFVKMDIEGAEVAALRGAPATISRCDRWLIETHGREIEDECRAILAEHDFRFQIQDARRWLPDLRPTEHNRWLIAVRPNVTGSSRRDG